ncbi:MAG: 5-formyltetrahydrofolate cyclo-ligase [bacterium]|nr:5-formyltetrahydrofolate cyclo-ligase [bacterium]
MDSKEQKWELRRTALERRTQLSSEARELANRQIFERAHKLDAFQLATTVHIYRSLVDEVDTWPFFEYAWGIGKSVFVPISTPSGLHHVQVTRDTQWTLGAYGIPEPLTDPSQIIMSGPAEVTVVIVPVVAFDTDCNRIGYGKGYYDRFLASTNVTSMGLAYECQKVERILSEEHDVALSCVASDQRWYIA